MGLAPRLAILLGVILAAAPARGAAAFTVIDAKSGWLVFSTDLLLSSHLHAFTLFGATTIGALRRFQAYQA